MNKKILIIGPTLYGNKGASAMFESCVQKINEMHTNPDFFLFSYYPSQDRKINNDPRIKIFSATPLNLICKILPFSLLHFVLTKLKIPPILIPKTQEIKAILTSDIYIDMAGISFVDNRQLYLPFNVLCILPGILLDKKIIKYSQAMGPFNSTINKRVSLWILPKLDKIIARGAITKKHLNQLQLKNVVMGADGAFLLKPTNPQSIKINKSIFDNEVVGISPSSVIFNKCNGINKDYIEIMSKFINELNDNKYKTILIPHSIRADTNKPKNNDLPICKKIYSKINKKDNWLINEDISASELKYLIGKCDYFVGSRFHSMIASLSMGVPTLVCGWSHKYEEVLDTFELEEYAFDYRNISVNIFLDKFNILTKNKSEIKSKIKERSDEVMKSALVNFSEINNLLET